VPDPRPQAPAITFLATFGVEPWNTRRSALAILEESRTARLTSGRCEPGLAAECLRQAGGPPTQGERRAPARVTFRHQRLTSRWSKTATRQRSTR
jgi:hypothetical protein